ncbi:MAG: hypothetical protein ABEH58_09345, partial [Haloplanus sp.]
MTSFARAGAFYQTTRRDGRTGLDEDALDYHRRDPPGKAAIGTTKSTSTQRDLSLAYSPDVAIPCRAIADDPSDAYEYTWKGALIGMVSNGSAVLGLGDTGARASKPVIEGKGVLLRRFADIDVFDFELDTDDPDAIEGADAFVGLAVGDLVDPEMVRSMARDPIVLAMANPDPEIDYNEAKSARDDTVIAATGRSDLRNRVNNVLGFPFIFRGALDACATEIDEAMQVAAARVLAGLARTDVPDAVARAYGDEPLQCGPEYLIPKALDPRVLFEVVPAVAHVDDEHRGGSVFDDPIRNAPEVGEA